MKWEDLKVYRPLLKADLKIAYKDFTRIISENLNQYGFELIGRKLIRKSDDLFHVIHIDTRGSWMGISESFSTEISIYSIYDTETFILNYELTSSKRIEDLIPNIRNHYRVTQEYPLLAEFITRKIIENVLPYFSQYISSADILNDRTNFKIDITSENRERNSNLILYCELANHIIKDSIDILQDQIAKLRQVNTESKVLMEYQLLLNLIQNKNWDSIDKILLDKKETVCKKLKLKNSI